MSRAWGKIFVAICIGLICLIALTPLLLSTSLGTSLLVSAFNRKIPGTIKVGKLSLSWLGNQKIEQFSLKSSQADPILSIKNLRINGPLPLLLWNPQNFNEIEVTDASVKIEQDSFGASNLENALGLKKIEGRLKTPVFVENAHIFVNQDSKGLFNTKASGSTRQNNLNGEFSLDITLENKGDQKVNLYAKHFPTLVLDQTLAISNPRLSGLLLALLGESIEISGKQDASSVKFFISSPLIQANIQGELTKEKLLIEEGSTVSFSIPSENIEKLKVAPFQILEPLKGKMSIHDGSIPLEKNLFHQLKGRISLLLNPNQIVFQDKTYQLREFAAELIADQKVDLKVQLNAKENDRPLSLNANAQFSKNLEKLKNEGLQFSAELKGSKIASTWEGTIRENATEINATLHSDSVSFKKMKINIPFLPFQEMIDEGKTQSPIEGLITIYRPELNSSFLAIDEVALPWTIDLNEDTLHLNLIAKVDAKEVIKGALRADQFSNFRKSALQLNLKLEAFHIEALHALFPSHPIKRILGDTIDAGLTASRDSNGFIEGCMDLSAPKNSAIFLKKISSSFTMQNNNQDLTFHTETQQSIGTTRFLGTFHNIWDEKGNFSLNKSSVSLQGNLKHFPVSVMAKIITGDEKIADSMEAVLGCQVDAELYAEIKDQQGPIRASMKGLNGQCNLNGKIVDNVLLLEEPITASLKVTPQLEHAVLRKYLPILGSVLSAEKPLELRVPIQGFKLPLNPLSLNQLQFQKAELELNKMQFLKDSPLGKIVSLIGVQTPQFEVWFTPIYFSLKNGIMRMERTDMLIAKTYPFATWGTADLNQQEMDVTVALSPPTLKKAFSLDMKPDSWFLVPIKGPIAHPKIDSATAMARLSALAATSRAGPPGKLMGTVIEAASDILGDKVPPATTDPLPWGDLMESVPASPASNNDSLDVPVEQLKKGAKKLLKELFK